MVGVRAAQKEKTRRAIIQAAFSQLSAQRSFSSLSLREVAREAGIAPTSFYRHFETIEVLGLTLVDESGLLLRQLMRQARQRLANGGSVIKTSVDTFMEFLDNHENEFRLLLQERSGISAEFRSAVSREIMHFTTELSEYIQKSSDCLPELAYIQAEAMVKLVFSAGAEAVDLDPSQRDQLAQKVIQQLRFVARGAASYNQTK